jgi:hypothetical protein
MCPTRQACSGGAAAGQRGQLRLGLGGRLHDGQADAAAARQGRHRRPQPRQLACAAQLGFF